MACCFGGRLALGASRMTNRSNRTPRASLKRSAIATSPASRNRASAPRAPGNSRTIESTSRFSVSIAPVGTPDRGATALRRLAVRAEPGGRAVVGGLVVLGPGESFVVACDVGSGCTAPGRFDLVARYVAGADAPAGTFVGAAASAACRVEVRAP